MAKKGRNKKEVLLFDKIKKGDKKAFEELFSLYYDALCNFAYLFVQDAQIAEEAVSDVFVNVWRKKDSINIQLNLRSYLYKSTKNAVVSYTRKRKLNIVSIEDYNEVKSIETPETLLIKKEVRAQFNNILATLPKRAGLVYRMHKVDGMKYREIAEVLNISEKTVENHMGNSLRHLRNLATKYPKLINYLITASMIGASIALFF